MSDQLHPSLEIRHTSSAGRSIFALNQINSNQVILRSSPFCHVILYEFRKEVCSYCFKYDNGTTFKFKIDMTGLWFCSETCLSKWKNDIDSNQSIQNLFIQLEKSRISAKRKVSKIPISQRKRPIESNEPISWKYIKSHPPLNSTNLEIIDFWWNTLPNTYPFSNEFITDYDYDQIKFILMAISQKITKEWKDMIKLQNSELSFFNHCKEKEISLSLLPSTILHHIHLYTIFQKVMKDIPHEIFRSVIYRDIGNSFGIYEEPLFPDSEFLGWALYPSASFFNHACWPSATISKHRDGRWMEFSIKKGSMLFKDAEATISYGGDEGVQRHADSEDEKSRRIRIKEGWMFDCCCSICQKDIDL